MKRLQKYSGGGSFDANNSFATSFNIVNPKKTTCL